MEFAPVLIFVGLLIFLSHLFVALFERTNIPDVLYLILIGIVIGPVLNIVSPVDFGKVGHVFTAVALVVILFEGGLELNLRQLRGSFRMTLVVTLASYTIAFGAITAISLATMDFPLPLTLYIAAVIAAPAPAVVIPLVQQLRMSATAKMMLTLESPIGEALGIVLALGVIDAIRFDSVQIGTLIGRLLASFTIALIFGGVAGFGWSMLLHRIRQLRFAIFTTPAFLLVLFGITEFLGFSGPTAALAFGATLANVGLAEIPWLTKRYNLTPLQHNETERAFFGEIVFLIKTFFFVYLGLSATFVDMRTLLLAGLFTAALLLSRLAAVRLSTSATITPRKDAVFMGVMIPRGTAAAVLAAIPLQMSLPGGEEIQNIIYAIVVISIIVTATLLFLTEKTPVGALLGLFFRGYPPEPLTDGARVSSDGSEGTPQRSKSKRSRRA